MNFDQFAIDTLKDRYYRPGDESPADVFHRVAVAFGDPGEHASRIERYLNDKWLSAATPILANAPGLDGSYHGLPISCFLQYVPDSIDGLLDSYSEGGRLSVSGGGLGQYWGHVRGEGAKTRNGKTPGIIPFLKTVDAQMLSYHQGGTRRGSAAIYLDITHPEIVEFIQMRKPTGGDANRKCLNLHHAVNIPDWFMELVLEAYEGKDPEFELVDPATGCTGKYLKVKDVWQALMEARASQGEPYIAFIDTINKALPKTQWDKGLRVHQSNLCSEITLPTNEDRTAVCCLSSVNLAFYDDWKDDKHFIGDVVRFLDNVLQYFIDNAKGVPKAVYSAMQERAIGIGAMGFHTLLQKRGVPWESPMAKSLNMQIFRKLKGEALAESYELATERGEAPDMHGTGLRNSHLLSVAPNASSSIIMGCSPSVEPYKSNAYVHKTLSGSHLVKNPQLEELLSTKGLNTDEVWNRIITNGGSVQDLLELTEWERDVYKTANEIDMAWIVELAGDRQEYLCQSQSINLYFNFGTDASRFSRLHVLAWKKGVKTLYYVRSEAARKAEKVSQKVERIYLDGSDCIACEG